METSHLQEQDAKSINTLKRFTLFLTNLSSFSDKQILVMGVPSSKSQPQDISLVITKTTFSSFFRKERKCKTDQGFRSQLSHTPNFVVIKDYVHLIKQIGYGLSTTLVCMYSIPLRHLNSRKNIKCLLIKYFSSFELSFVLKSL